MKAPPSGSKGGQPSTPTITSDALTTAEAFDPTFSPSSATASLVIEAVTVAPPMSILTWLVTAPLTMAVTVPGRTLRALSYMVIS